MIVVGAGGLAAATVADKEGLDTLVLEKTSYVGGTMSYAGGMVWSSNHLKKGEVGCTDTLDDAQTYLNATAGTYPDPGITSCPALVFGYIVGMHLAGGE
mgnify:CR=1 FL=1